MMSFKYRLALIMDRPEQVHLKKSMLVPACQLSSQNCVEYILKEFPESIDIPFNNLSAIGAAAQAGDVHIMRLLIDAGADIYSNNMLICPVNVAIQHSNEECVRLLLDAGALPSFAEIFDFAEDNPSILRKLFEMGMVLHEHNWLTLVRKNFTLSIVEAICWGMKGPRNVDMWLSVHHPSEMIFVLCAFPSMEAQLSYHFCKWAKSGDFSQKALDSARAMIDLPGISDESFLHSMARGGARWSPSHFPVSSRLNRRRIVFYLWLSKQLQLPSEIFIEHLIPTLV